MGLTSRKKVRGEANEFKLRLVLVLRKFRIKGT